VIQFSRLHFFCVTRLGTAKFINFLSISCFLVDAGGAEFQLFIKGLVVQNTLYKTSWFNEVFTHRDRGSQPHTFTLSLLLGMWH